MISSHLNHQDITFRLVKKDVFTSTSIFFNALEFLRGKTGEIKEFTITTDGVVNMTFKKLQ